MECVSFQKLHNICSILVHFCKDYHLSKHFHLVENRLSRNPSNGEGMTRKRAETPQNGGGGDKGREKDH